MAYDLTQKFTPIRDNQPDQLGPGPCIKEGMTTETCRYNNRLGCDCGFHKGTINEIPTV